MEDWHEGEVHGAFEIVKSLDEADAQTAHTLCIGGAVVTGFLVVGGLLFFLLVTRSITNPLAIHRGGLPQDRRGRSDRSACRWNRRMKSASCGSRPT